MFLELNSVTVLSMVTTNWQQFVVTNWQEVAAFVRNRLRMYDVPTMNPLTSWLTVE